MAHSSAVWSLRCLGETGLSARSEREFRALEVCEMMRDPHTVQLAIKYEDDYSSQVTGVRQAAVSTQEDEVEMEEEPAQLSATPAEKSAPTDKPVTPFSLWLEEAGSELRAENPDKDDDDFNKFAADTFRALPKEEKQGYVQRSKELNDRSKENTGGGEDGTENRKRKREIDETGDASKKLRDEDTDTVKKPLGQTANSKLANFAFKGDS
ncbi:WDHD1-like protein [Mya arenaria]|uniref:WDHD1-like protein n=1 Tax=Mya arenaria TaxID=6604 RepID=A0ABY7FDY8_MYAAR|nr:WDHD1-like protein [Mya arenaria]